MGILSKERIHQYIMGLAANRRLGLFANQVIPPLVNWRKGMSLVCNANQTAHSQKLHYAKTWMIVLVTSATQIRSARMETSSVHAKTLFHQRVGLVVLSHL
jgi:hypothetical protein